MYILQSEREREKEIYQSPACIYCNQREREREREREKEINRRHVYTAIRQREREKEIYQSPACIYIADMRIEHVFEHVRHRPVERDHVLQSGVLFLLMQINIVQQEIKISDQQIRILQ